LPRAKGEVCANAKPKGEIEKKNPGKNKNKFKRANQSEEEGI